MSHYVKLVEARYKYGLVLIALALLNEQDGDPKNEEGELLDNIRLFTDKISVVLIPMISSLGDLQIDEVEESLVGANY